MEQTNEIFRKVFIGVAYTLKNKTKIDLRSIKDIYDNLFYYQIL